MPSPSETLKAAQAALSALSEHLSAIADLAEQHQAAESALAASGKEIESWQAKTSAAKAEIESIKRQLAGNVGVFDDDKARTLKALRDQISRRTDELGKVEGELKSKTKAYDALAKSMAALAAKEVA